MLLQSLLVRHFGYEYVPAFLDVCDARLPEHVQQIHLAYGHVAQPAQLLLVPEYPVNACARLQFLPKHVRIHFFEVVLLQNARNNIAQALRLLLVPFFPWQNVRLWVILDPVRMLGYDHIKKPCAGVLRLSRLGIFLHHLPMPHLPPLLVGHEPIFQVALSRLVPHQRIRCLAKLRLGNRRRARRDKILLSLHFLFLPHR